MNLILPYDASRPEPYSRITPQLAVGSAVAPGEHYPFDAIFLCAKEHQPPEQAFTRAGTGRRPLIVHVPLDDGPPLTRFEEKLALDAGRLCAALLLQGKHVLCSCMMGRNRSAFIAALGLHGAYGLGGPAVLKMIRERRSPGRHPAIPDVLSNEHFVRFVERVAGRR